MNFDIKKNTYISVYNVQEKFYLTESRRLLHARKPSGLQRDTIRTRRNKKEKDSQRAFENVYF